MLRLSGHHARKPNQSSFPTGSIDVAAKLASRHSRVERFQSVDAWFFPDLDARAFAGGRDSGFHVSFLFHKLEKLWAGDLEVIVVEDKS